MAYNSILYDRILDNIFPILYNDYNKTNYEGRIKE